MLTLGNEHGALVASPIRTGQAHVKIADSLMRTILLINLVVRVESPAANGARSFIATGFYSQPPTFG